VPIAVLVFPLARQRPPHEERDERKGEPRFEHDDPQPGTHLATPSLSPRKPMIEHLRWSFLAPAALIAGCALQPLPEGACPCPGPPAVAPRINPLEPVDFGALAGWKEGEQAAAWPAFLASCQALRWRETWRGVCARAMELRSPSDEEARRFLEENFTPWRLANPDGALEGLVTGYYEPLLRGSRVRTTPFVYPLYGPPEDLLTIDLSATNPELRGMRLRGRVEGKRVVPYYSRAEIARGAAPIAGKEILWVDDPIEAFFLQIQGSGRVQIEGGETLRVGYADQNGHPFQSIGRYLVERGELQLGEASMSATQPEPELRVFSRTPARRPGERPRRRARRSTRAGPLDRRRSALRPAWGSGISRDDVSGKRDAAHPPGPRSGYGRCDPQSGARGFLLGVWPRGGRPSWPHAATGEDVGPSPEGPETRSNRRCDALKPGTPTQKFIS